MVTNVAIPATFNTGVLMTGTRHTTGETDRGFRRKPANHEGHGTATLRLVEQNAPAVLPPTRTLKAQRLFDLFTAGGTKVLD